MESPEESNCEFGNCKRPPSLLSVQDFGSSTLQKRDAAHPLYGISHSLLLCHKHFFSHTTDWANPVFRKIFKCCSRCDSVVRITHLRVIYISAWFTNIFLHFIFSFLPVQIVRITIFIYDQYNLYYKKNLSLNLFFNKLFTFFRQAIHSPQVRPPSQSSLRPVYILSFSPLQS